MHAAGVVISEGPLSDHVPCFKSDETIVTQYDKDDVEAAGLVKFDFLGLKTLTVIDIAEKLVNARPDRIGNPLSLSKIPLDDKESYALVASGETTGVFQLESSGMQQLLRGLKPDCFEDIVAAVALYRPGPLGTGMIDDFIASKHGRKAIRKLHPLIDDVLAPTYGVPVYQEQVMQIAQQLAGFSLGGADLLRRAMGKKKAEEMQKQLQAFTEGALARGVSVEQSTAIFNEIEGFASYGFNKSHSAAYALITYQTAYLKAHYPCEFFAAVMTADKDKIEKVVRTIAEARAWGVAVLPPDINLSETDFSVVYTHPKGDGSMRSAGRLRESLRPAGALRFGRGARRGRSGPRDDVRCSQKLRAFSGFVRLCDALGRQALEQGRARVAGAMRRVRLGARTHGHYAFARVCGDRSRARALAQREPRSGTRASDHVRHVRAERVALERQWAQASDAHGRLSTHRERVGTRSSS